MKCILFIMSILLAYIDTVFLFLFFFLLFFNFFFFKFLQLFPFIAYYLIINLNLQILNFLDLFDLLLFLCLLLLPLNSDLNTKLRFGNSKLMIWHTLSIVAAAILTLLLHILIRESIFTFNGIHFSLSIHFLQSIG